MAGSEQIQAARRQFEEVWSKGNLDIVNEIMSDDFVRHGPDLEGGQISGRDGFKGLVTLFRTGLPDMDVPVDEMHEIGDRVIVRWRVTGTNTGGALGQPANGKRVEIIGQHTIRFAGGQIVEEWVAYDTLGFIKQLELQV